MIGGGDIIEGGEGNVVGRGVENNTTRSCTCSPTCMSGAAFSIVCSSRV